MTSSAGRDTSADARREAQRKRIEATRIKRPCPACKGNRLFPRGGAGNANKIICYDCGARYKRKKA